MFIIFTNEKKHNEICKLFDKIEFEFPNFRSYKCYPEIMLLAYALSYYISEQKEIGDKTQELSIISLLLEYGVVLAPPYETHLDRRFTSNSQSEGAIAYRAFKKSSEERQKEAVAALLEYYLIEQYL